MSRAVLFDMDDTLLLTREVKWAHHRHVALESYGITLDDATLAEHWGKSFDEMIGLLYQHADTVEAMRAANKASAERFRKLPVPGAVELVEGLLDQDVAVGVVTSTNTDMALADLEGCGFPMPRLALVHGADVTGHHKPDPRVFDAALDQLAREGVDHVTYVGDALMDAQASDEAGLDFEAVTTGLFNAEAFVSLGLAPERVVAGVDELRPLLGL